jgi:undecaprenyl pyrophosphate phosphatase UppP
MSAEGQQGFRISQGYDLALPKNDNALPIPLADWNNLKASVRRIDTESSWFKDIGLLLIGAGISTLITILTGTFTADPTVKYLPVAWSAVIVTLVIGVCCLIFAYKSKKFVRSRASDAVEQMDQIEQRFDFRG